MTTTKNVVSYARVSTDSQAERNTIEVQLEAIRGYCASHGYAVSAEFKDDGVSGAIPFGDRPEGARLLASGARHVIIYCADRLGRDSIEAQLAMREFKRRGVEIEFTTQSFDDTPEGVFTFQVMMAVGQLERALITRRTHGGITKAVRSGNLYKTGSAPFGYTYSKDTHQLTVEPARAATVRRIFRDYTSGQGVYKIAAALTAEGIPSPGTASTKTHSDRLGGAWHASTVRSILRSPTYKGLASYGADKIPMTCPAIVAEATWDKVQRLMTARSSKGSASKRTYLAQGVLVCGVCGFRMSAYTGDHGAAKYRCNQRAVRGYVTAVRQAHEGYAWALHAEPLEERVKVQVRKVMANPLTLAAHVEARVDAVADAYDERLGAANSVARSLADVAAQETRVLDLAQQGVMDATQTRTRIAALVKERKALTRQAKTAERDVADVRAIEAQLEEFAGTLADLLSDEALDVQRDGDDRATWREPRTDAEWALIVRTLYDRIEVSAPIGGKTALTYSGIITVTESS